MKKIFLFAGFFCLASMLSHLDAQSINNKSWWASFGDPINDTLTFHIHSDSSFVTTSKGDVMLRTNCIISGDTLTLSDYGTGEHTCPDMGKYKINMKGNIFSLTVITDPCEGRAQALNDVKWTQVPKK
ncbi:MAG TPA: hypothetical protein VK588_15285 [Chitinophagaceae bacterium]|nr:hypothetical protein [Chitinophagaceae bacterium]